MMLIGDLRIALLQTMETLCISGGHPRLPEGIQFHVQNRPLIPGFLVQKGAFVQLERIRVPVTSVLENGNFISIYCFLSVFQRKL